MTTQTQSTINLKQLTAEHLLNHQTIELVTDSIYGKSRRVEIIDNNTVKVYPVTVEQAIQALRDPNTYEQAKKVLLAQPKSIPSIVTMKTRSWQGILEFYSYHIEVVKELGVESTTFGYSSTYAEYRFDTPTTTDNRLVYVRNSEGIFWEIGHRANLKSEKWLCNQFSQAFNFRYGGRSIYNYTPIDHYWDDKRLKMILLP